MRSGKAVGALFTTAVYLVVAWSMLVYAPSADSATITIDSFNYPDPGTTFYVPGEAPWGSGNPYDHKDAGVSEVIGGERDIHVEVVGSALPISAAGIIGYEPIYDSGAFLLATSGRAGTLAVAQYDGTAGGGLGGVDFTDGGTNKLFRLGFDTVDGGDGTSLPLTITVVGHAGGSTSVQTQVPANAAASDFDVPFVAFPDDGAITSASIISNAASIEFEFNALATPVPNVDFQLDYVEAVPEPATLVMLLGLGVSMLAAGVWSRRKRQN